MLKKLTTVAAIAITAITASAHAVEAYKVIKTEKGLAVERSDGAILDESMLKLDAALHELRAKEIKEQLKTLKNVEKTGKGIGDEY